MSVHVPMLVDPVLGLPSWSLVSEPQTDEADARWAQMSALDWLRLLDEPVMTACWHGYEQAR